MLCGSLLLNTGRHTSLVILSAGWLAGPQKAFERFAISDLADPQQREEEEE